MTDIFTLIYMSQKVRITVFEAFLCAIKQIYVT